MKYEVVMHGIIETEESLASDGHLIEGYLRISKQYVGHIPRSCNAAAHNVTQFSVRSNVDVWMDEVPTWPVLHLS